MKEGRRKSGLFTWGQTSNYTFDTITYILYEIYQMYLEDISFSKFKCSGFKLNPLSWLGLNGVDAFMIVIVVHRKVGGKQSALCSRDRIPTLSWKEKENYNNHTLTHIGYNSQ